MPSPTTLASVAAAIAHLDASPATRPGWWSYQPDAQEECGKVFVSTEELAELGELLLDGELNAADSYSEWCAWTPTRTSEPEAPEPQVLVEYMPDEHKASHRAAGNWGTWPYNGAVRERMKREDADEIVQADEDGYARIID
jgi:hypothetical protein